LDRELLPGPRPVRGAAVARRGRRAARPVRRDLRVGHHHQPHLARVRVDRHRAAERAEGGVTVLLFVIVLPLAMALVAFATPSPRVRAWLVPAGGVLHGAITTYLVIDLPPPMFDGSLAIGPLGRVLLGFLGAP